MRCRLSSAKNLEVALLHFREESVAFGVLLDRGLVLRIVGEVGVVLLSEPFGDRRGTARFRGVLLGEGCELARVHFRWLRMDLTESFFLKIRKSEIWHGACLS